jgi:hemerythrin-like domain-containing protein
VTGENRDPFERLVRCHRRLEECLDDLARAVREKNVVALRDVSAFFDRQLRRHEVDEERSLFPRLAASENVTLRSLAARLENEHRDHEALHARLERIRRALERDDDTSDLAPCAEAIAAAYRTHIHEEEKTLFPLARAELPPVVLDAIAREMEERRGR